MGKKTDAMKRGFKSKSESVKERVKEKKKINKAQKDGKDFFKSAYNPADKENRASALKSSKADCKDKYGNEKICRETKTGSLCRESDKVCIRSAEKIAKKKT